MANLRSVIGLMSGTSMDGIDVAHLTTDGEEAVEFGPARTYAWSASDRASLARALEAAPRITARDERPEPMAEAERLVTSRHVEAVETFCRETGLHLSQVQLIGFHGQTVLHDPARRLTVQLGDGQALSDQLGIAVAWDLRAGDIEAGGQGAPLAPVFHRALAGRLAHPLPHVFLNIGGVANVTWIGPDGALVAFDTGPGNALMDDWVNETTGQSFDVDGRLALAGTPAEAVVRSYLQHPFFKAPPPKSLDRNAYDLDPVRGMSAQDGAATLLAFTVESVLAASAHFPAQPRLWVGCGGGRRNRTLIDRLARALADRGESLLVAEDVGLDGDAIEAQAFAYMAVRSARGLPITFPGTTGVPTPTCGGRIAEPARLIKPV